MAWLSHGLSWRCYCIYLQSTISKYTMFIMHSFELSPQSGGEGRLYQFNHFIGHGSQRYLTKRNVMACPLSHWALTKFLELSNRSVSCPTMLISTMFLPATNYLPATYDLLLSLSPIELFYFFFLQLKLNYSTVLLLKMTGIDH